MKVQMIFTPDDMPVSSFRSTIGQVIETYECRSSIYFSTIPHDCTTVCTQLQLTFYVAAFYRFDEHRFLFSFGDPRSVRFAFHRTSSTSLVGTRAGLHLHRAGLHERGGAIAAAGHGGVFYGN